MTAENTRHSEKPGQNSELITLNIRIENPFIILKARCRGSVFVHVLGYE
jgi:hypothetical protein